MKTFNVTVKTDAGTRRYPYIGRTGAEAEIDARRKFGWLSGVSVILC